MTELIPDTVENATATPAKDQPYDLLGLKPDEYQQIRDILGRRPTSGELAMYSVMWSEHCSYKSSKVHLRQFGEKVTAQPSPISTTPAFSPIPTMRFLVISGVTFCPN